MSGQRLLTTTLKETAKMRSQPAYLAIIAAIAIEPSDNA
jgi:hypothetical protein